MSLSKNVTMTCVYKGSDMDNEKYLKKKKNRKIKLILFLDLFITIFQPHRLYTMFSDCK